MRHIINSTYITLDGMTEQLEKWHFGYHDESAVKFATDLLFGCDAMLMGRKTYDVFATVWPTRSDDYADRINSMKKYVASTTLDTAEWNNSTIIGGDLVENVTELKQRPGQDILMNGFGPVARTLLQQGLLDELHLWVHPLFIGTANPGDLIFRNGSTSKLNLIGAKTLDSGIAILSYQPAGNA